MAQRTTDHHNMVVDLAAPRSPTRAVDATAVANDRLRWQNQHLTRVLDRAKDQIATLQAQLTAERREHQHTKVKLNKALRGLARRKNT